jgi:hypothetical protein
VKIGNEEARLRWRRYIHDGEEMVNFLVFGGLTSSNDGNNEGQPHRDLTCLLKIKYNIILFI